MRLIGDDPNGSDRCELFGRWPFDCVTRPESANPATGSSAAHKKEQAQLIAEALG